MRFFKIVDDGLITSIGNGAGGIEITESEYNEIKEITKSMPIAPDGYDYALTDNLQWELVELPPMPDPEPTTDEIIGYLFGGDAE